MNDNGKLTQEEMDTLLGSNNGSKTEEPFHFSELTAKETKQLKEESVNLPLLLDIPLEVVVELGRTKKKISEVLEWTSGSIVDLDKMAGEPVDIYVNKKLVAKGEVVVIDEHFGVRLTEISPAPF